MNYLMRKGVALSLALLPAAVVATAAPTAAAAAAGVPGNAESTSKVVSKTGRYVAFLSEATNLVPGDTNGRADIFVRDLVARTTKRVTVSANGAQANSDENYIASISADGRYVACSSDATNLVPRDTNNEFDAFRKDLRTGQVLRLSTSLSGQQAQGQSAVGAMSSNGQRLILASTADNLVPGDTRAGTDVFIRDLAAGSLTRISATIPAGADLTYVATDLSENGGIAVFNSRRYDSSTEETCATIWMWKAGTGKVTKAEGYCFDSSYTNGYDRIFANNGGYASATSYGYDYVRGELDVPAQAGAPAYYRSCDGEFGTCSYDLAAWGHAGVQDLEAGSGLIRFDYTGATKHLKYGYRPAISADGFMIAFQDGNQVKAWNYRTGAVTLVSQSSG